MLVVSAVVLLGSWPAVAREEPSDHTSKTTFDTWFRMQVEHSTTLPLSGKGHRLDGGMPAAERAEFAIAAEGGKLLDLGIDRGFRSLTHDGAAQIWRRLIPRRGGPGSPPDLPEGLADRIAYVRASRAAEKVSPLLRVAAAYLGAYYGENDGLVEVKDQAISGVGTIITTLDADHASLMLAGPVSDQSDRVRRAFTQALLMQLSGAFDR